MQALTYTRYGDYYIPDICLDAESRPIGRWERMNRDYIKEYRLALYSKLCINGGLVDLKEQAQNRLNTSLSK